MGWEGGVCISSGDMNGPLPTAADERLMPWNSEDKLGLRLPLLKWERGWAGPSFAWGCYSFPLVNGKKQASLEGEWEQKPKLGCPGGTAVSLLTTRGSWEASLWMIKLFFLPASFPNWHEVYQLINDVQRNKGSTHWKRRKISWG